MNDTPNETTQDEHEPVTSTDEVVTEDRSQAEEKPKRRRRGGLGFLFLLLVIAAGAVAAWYYKPMWLPQAKTLVAKWWPFEKEQDPLAAPAVDKHYLGKSDSTFVLPAIPDPEPQAKVDEATVPAAEAQAEEEKQAETPVASDNEDNKAAMDDGKTAMTDTTSDVAAAVQDEKPVMAEPSTMPEEKPAMAEPSTDTAIAASPEMPEKPGMAEETRQDMAMMDKAMDSMPAEESATAVVSLQQARQAYWSRDLVGAENLYRQVVASADANADAWGELGNVYYRQAKWSDAANAYAEAAVRLLQHGDYSQAMYMRYIVTGLDPRQLNKIDEQLQRMQAPAGH